MRRNLCGQMNLKLVYGFMMLFSCCCAADEGNYLQWEQLNQLAHDGSQRSSYLPATMSPCTSQSGVFQQVFNYNLQEFKKINSTARLMDTQWGAHNSTATASTTVVTQSSTTFQMKPFETKAWIDFAHQLKASLNYQIFNRTTEFLLTPKKTFFGMSVGYSYMITAADQQNRVSFRYDW